MSTDIRTISYLLHPPLLDEAGLASALTWYVRGFSDRSKINVDLQMPEDFGRLPRELETAIFRVVQECLTNIHRHSQSSTARVQIKRNERDVRIEVEDSGKGMTAEKCSQVLTSGSTPGVGIRGMRERIRQLGGKLDIHSDGEGKGTRVVTHLPIDAPAEMPAMKSVAAASATP